MGVLRGKLRLGAVRRRRASSGMGVFAATSQSKTPIREVPLDKIEFFLAGKGGYRRYRIPALVVSGRGTVLAFCEARRHTGEDHDEIDILVRRSTDRRPDLGSRPYGRQRWRSAPAATPARSSITEQERSSSPFARTTNRSLSPGAKTMASIGLSRRR